MEKTLLPEDNMHEATYESDETLSFCDLPLYSDHQSVEWKQDLSAQSHGSTSVSSSEEQEFFEFCSQELSPPTAGFPPESIIFCGKLIPHKKQRDTLEEESSKLVKLKTKGPTNIRRKRGWGMLRWAFCLSKDHDKSTNTLMHKEQSGKNTYNSNKHGKGCDLSIHEMPILTPSYSGKARWYHLFLSGVSRFSSEVELKDVKNRLSRRHCPSQPPPSTILNDGAGLTGLIRVLSCSGKDHPNTMIVASTSFSQQK